MMTKDENPRLVDHAIRTCLISPALDAKIEEIINKVLSEAEGTKSTTSTLLDSVCDYLRQSFDAIASDINADEYVKDHNRVVSIKMTPTSKSYLQPELERKRKNTKDIKEYLSLTLSAEYWVEGFVERGV